jgi:nucleotide-binding universal stress UspA family protein
MRAVLAAIDFSSVTDLVVAEAAALARAIGGKVVLVTVLVEPVYVKEYARPSKSIEKITVAHERAVRNHLAAIQNKLQSDFIPAETVVRRGNAAVHILEEADEHDAAFIVIGSHGHTAFFELVLGSTTQTVVKRARQPVVVVPPKMRKPRRPRVRVLADAV